MCEYTIKAGSVKRDTLMKTDDCFNRTVINSQFKFKTLVHKSAIAQDLRIQVFINFIEPCALKSPTQVYHAPKSV